MDAELSRAAERHARYVSNEMLPELPPDFPTSSANHDRYQQSFGVTSRALPHSPLKIAGTMETVDGDDMDCSDDPGAITTLSAPHHVTRPEGSMGITSAAATRPGAAAIYVRAESLMPTRQHTNAARISTAETPAKLPTGIKGVQLHLVKEEPRQPSRRQRLPPARLLKLVCITIYIR